MQVKANRLDRGFQKYQTEFEQKALDVLRSGRYVLGKEVHAFETEFAEFTGAEHCVGVGSGLDALWLGIRALGIGQGDEVIVQGNTYIASVMGITMNRAVPVFVEPDEYYQIDADKIEEKITAKTKAVMVVHLYGQVAQMDEILRLCEKYNLKLIEDCAQSHGASFGNKITGTFGDIGCFSFYPSKNLGGFGEGGAVITDNAQIAEMIRVLRNYGSEKRYCNKVVGTNSRLDEMQAGLLRIRLAHIEEITREREILAKRYMDGIRNDALILPKERAKARIVWHQYVVRTRYRDKFQEYLRQNEIETIIHYPIPPHLSEAYQNLSYKRGDLPITEKYADEVLSIPIYSGMSQEEQNYVIETINGYKGI
ncbi:MAG: DegT/DnrJ/EryC1/StrS family aminotransferase [Lachnospiraceae bacterium]|nr:DegT/DnrJ/EryC1/StrS family aminotransferase [Lachnospiraceae bacterium]